MSGNRIRGLSIIQEKAARMMVEGKHTTDKQISEALGIKKAMLAQWKTIPQFKLRVLQLMDSAVDLERAYRLKHISRYLKPIYKEIRKRLRNKDGLEAYPLKELIRMMSVLHNELRQDGNFNRRFLDAGVKDYGENVPDSEDIEEEIDMSNVSDLYEERRKRETS